MKNLVKATGLVLSLGLASCASINSVSLTPVPAGRQSVVRAQVEKTIILGFNFDNDYVNPITQDLKRQCPNGLVSGILTKDEIISYVFWHTHRVVATGYCSSGTSASNGVKRGTASDEGAE